MKSSRRPARLPIHGVLLLDKPAGTSSNHALQQVKRLFSAQKAGHAGTLDPLATGMLPICFGDATKFCHLLLDAVKEYEFTCQLGAATTTGDCEGEICQQQAVPAGLNVLRIEAALACFRGEIQQVPPMYSALKHQGKRLYELARAGTEVERPSRMVHIYALELLNCTADSFSCRVACSKGTYVRTLAEDISLMLQTCGHLIALRRTAVTPYQAQPMHSIAQLAERAGQGSDALSALLLPVDSALSELEQFTLPDPLATLFGNGCQISHFREHADGQARIYREDGYFSGLGEWRNGVLWPIRCRSGS